MIPLSTEERMTVWLTPDWKEAPGAPALHFRFLSFAEARAFAKLGADTERLKSLDDMAGAELVFAALGRYVVGWDGFVTPDGLPLIFGKDRLEDGLEEFRAWKIYWRVLLRNRLGPEEKKGSASPSASGGADSVADTVAPAGNQMEAAPVGLPSSGSPA